MRTRINSGIIGQTVTLTASSTGFFSTLDDHRVGQQRGTWPTWTAPIIPAPKSIVADSAYNAQGWVSGSTDYVGTTQAFSFNYAGLQGSSGGARTVTLPYNGLKYYLEILISSASSNALIGLAGDANAGGYSNYPCIYMANGGAYGGYTTSVGTQFGVNDILQIAYNSTTNLVFYGKNGTWSIDPVSGTGVSIPNASTNGSVRVVISSGSSGGSSETGTFKKAADRTYSIPTGYTYASL